MSRFGKEVARGGVYSLRQLVLHLVIGTIISIGSMSIELGVTIAGSNAPGAVEIKIIKEKDVATKSLLNLPEPNARLRKIASERAEERKKSETNLAKLSRFGKELQEEVYSLRQLVLHLVIGTIISIGSMSIELGDHIILVTHRPGAI